VRVALVAERLTLRAVAVLAVMYSAQQLPIRLFPQAMAATAAIPVVMGVLAAMAGMAALAAVADPLWVGASMSALVN